MWIRMQLSFELRPKWVIKLLQSSKSKNHGAIMKLEVITPEENMGDIVGDLNRRRGQVNDMSDRAGC